eukprot:gene26723-35403_t
MRLISKTTFGEYLTVSAPIHKWEEVFDTEFYEFDVQPTTPGNSKSEKIQAKIHRCMKYSIPKFLRGHVSAVFNTVQFPDVAEFQADRFFGYTTPALINKLYDIRNNNGNLLGSQGLYEALGQYFSPADLTNFQQLFNLPLQKESKGDKCAEANLDVADMQRPPKGALTPSSVQAFDTEAMKLGLRGITLVAAHHRGNRIRQHLYSYSTTSIPSSAGRGYPDVSALGHNFVVGLAGNFTAVSGTSASSPLMLANAARLSKGMSLVGWVNPAVYASYPSFINDIVDGSNHCIARESVCCNQGYYATTGWDPVTGLGSVNVTAFIATFLKFGASMPVYSKSPSATPPLRTPSALPSSQPTVAPGWLYITTYTETGCAGEVVDVEGIITGDCMLEYGTSGSSVVGSRKHICDDVYVTVEYYSDSACSENKLLATDLYGLGCARKVENYYYTDNFFSKSLYCAANRDIPPLLPVTDTPFNLLK